MIESKKCARCGNVQPIDQFCFQPKKQAFYSYCRTCVNERARERNRRPDQKEKKRSSSAAYAATDRGKRVRQAAVGRYAKTEKGKANAHRYYLAHKDQARARDAVHKAILKGMLPPAQSLPCAMAGTGTGCRGTVAYHHHLGYAVEHRLHVIPLCKKHHSQVDYDAISRVDRLLIGS